MKLIFSIILTVSFLFSSDQIPAPEQDHPILIRGGWIHTVSNGVLENGEILFDKGKIISGGHNLNISPETEIIDAG